MAAILNFQDGHYSNLILPITLKLNMTEGQNQRLYQGFAVRESSETNFEIPTWPPSSLFNMGAIHLLIFLINLKLKVIETQTQMLYLGSSCQQIPWDYFQNSKMAAILDFQDGGHSKYSVAYNSKT